MDNVYSFNDNGDLVADTSGTWLAVNGQTVAYYHLDTVEDGDAYTITGRIPAYLNGDRVNLLVVFDDENPNGYIAGAVYDYVDGETETVAKSLTEINDGDEIDFVCDYYGRDGSYEDSYLIGETLVVNGALTLSDMYIPAARARITYCFRDMYEQEYWSDPLSVTAGG